MALQVRLELVELAEVVMVVARLFLALAVQALLTRVVAEVAQEVPLQ